MQPETPHHLFEAWEATILSGQVSARDLHRWLDDDPAFASWLRRRADFRQATSLPEPLLAAGSRNESRQEQPK